jgi:hypothetical protein
MQDMVNLKKFPLDQPDSNDWRDLVFECQTKLKRDGLINLSNFIGEQALLTAVSEVKPVLSTSAFIHTREHNIYFKDAIDGLPENHPALRAFRTVNHTICADQIEDSVIMRLYQWTHFSTFLAAVMKKERLFTMEDPLARVNVMGYNNGEQLNWHFDRSEFTTTLLLQAPESGGYLEYSKDLRSEDDPNYAGVAKLLDGDEPTIIMPMEAGTLNIFRGKNTAHRVKAVEGDRQRIVAVFSYFERPGVVFSKEEQIGFYGRAI